MELPDEIYDKITALSEKGDQYAEHEQFTSALKQYEEALALLPEPKMEWEAATWLYVAIGDAWFNKQKLNEAMDAYQKVLMSPDGTGNPYVWFSIGQIYFEQENYEKAKTHFMSAYMLDGTEIFEDENPEYFKLIKEETEKAPDENI
ncbi:tetratricopeptide repeat protein [Pedobacter petrophilus]|uniref:Tetratricopeptide repeat protein n=1 Tax=Pedobacter petrophilus TaxID=1908241 RepID=A0A7K0G722_9SPHI|nr:tetratricopeptide repeat protein [Pedobacter petrophilus]MRX78786.1 tetratricopeptide repeat protein [Pedobacter petrophilus]